MFKTHGAQMNSNFIGIITTGSVNIVTVFAIITINISLIIITIISAVAERPRDASCH